MSAELEVNTRPLRFLQPVRLVVQEDGEPVRCIRQFGEGFPPGIGAVIPADDPDSGEIPDLVPEKVDAGRLEEPFGRSLVAVVLVISQNRPYRSVQAAEFRRVIPFQDRPDAPVDDIPADEDQVRMLGVEEVHPPAQLRLPVVVAYMQITCKDNRKGFVQRLLRLDGHLLAILVPVMDASRHQDDRRQAKYRPQAGGAVAEQ